jgi:hypothetical protein
MRMKAPMTHVCSARKEAERRETIGQGRFKSCETTYLSESYAILSRIQ